VTEEHEPYAKWRHQVAKKETELSDDKVFENQKVSFLGDEDGSHTENNATRSDNDKGGSIESKNLNGREGHKEDGKNEQKEDKVILEEQETAKLNKGETSNLPQEVSIFYKMEVNCDCGRNIFGQEAIAY
jgi:hypothetical protein